MADPCELREFETKIPDDRHTYTKKCRRFPKTDYILKKRRPFGHGGRGDKDIFVTKKTNFKAQLKKCEKLFDNGATEVIIHGLGAAIPRACNLALQLKELHHSGVELDTKTSTVSIVDDFEPLKDDADYEINNRNNSAVHIRVFRKFLIGGLRYQD